MLCYYFIIQRFLLLCVLVYGRRARSNSMWSRLAGGGACWTNNKCFVFILFFGTLAFFTLDSNSGSPLPLVPPRCLFNFIKTRKVQASYNHRQEIGPLDHTLLWLQTTRGVAYTGDGGWLARIRLVPGCFLRVQRYRRSHSSLTNDMSGQYLFVINVRYISLTVSRLFLAKPNTQMNRK